MNSEKGIVAFERVLARARLRSGVKRKSSRESENEKTQHFRIFLFLKGV